MSSRRASLAVSRRLRDEWSSLVGDGAAGVIAGEDLLQRWTAPHRRYHDLQHLAEVLDHLAELGGHAPAVRLAAWYHDAIYEPHRSDNEAASAALAAATLDRLGFEADIVAEVDRLVRLTATHLVQPGDGFGACLCDADLAVLGSPPSRYASYRAGVRSEYGTLTDAEWRAGRTRVLSALLGRPVIYVTATGFQRWEEAARVNLDAELSELQG